MSKFVEAVNLPDLLFNNRQNIKTSAIYNYAHILDAFSIALADYRFANELSQKDLANLLQVSQSMISQYESASRNISIKTLCEYCERLGITPHISFEIPNTPGKVIPSDDMLFIPEHARFA